MGRVDIHSKDYRAGYASGLTVAVAGAGQQPLPAGVELPGSDRSAEWLTGYADGIVRLAGRRNNGRFGIRLGC